MSSRGETPWGETSGDEMSWNLSIPAPTLSLKSSKVGADMTLADRPVQRRTLDSYLLFGYLAPQQ